MWQNSRKIHEEQVASFPWPLRAKHGFRFIFLEIVEAYSTVCVDILLNSVVLFWTLVVFFFFASMYLFLGGDRLHQVLAVSCGIFCCDSETL